MTRKPDNRLVSETLDMRLPVGNGFHDLTCSIAFDGNGFPTELVFVRRGKSGGQLDEMFVELGVMISRALQRRNPQTGEAVR